MQVSVSMSGKVNIGNYESIGVDIGVTDEARVIKGNVETAEQAFNRVYSFVEAKLVEKLQAIHEEFNGENKK